MQSRKKQAFDVKTRIRVTISLYFTGEDFSGAMVYICNREWLKELQAVSRTELEEAAGKILTENLGVNSLEKPYEQFGIIYDGWPPAKGIVKAFEKKWYQLCGNSAQIIEIESYKTRDANSPINVDLTGYDLFVAPTGQSVTHAIAAENYGSLRGLSMPGIDAYNLMRGTRTDKALVKKLANDVISNLGDLRKITIYTGDGKELEDMHELNVKLAGKPPWKDDGDVLGIHNWPYGECGFLPESGDGEILIHFSSETKRPFLLYVEDREITGGDKYAKPFIKRLSKHKNGMNFAEVGVGINPDMWFGGPLLSLNDICWIEKILGNIHIGCGNDRTFGGNVYSDIHMDAANMLNRIFSGKKEVNLLNSYDTTLRDHFESPNLEQLSSRILPFLKGCFPRLYSRRHRYS